MAISQITMTQDDPVHFRVRSFKPSPLPAPLSQPGQLIFSIELLNGATAGVNYAMCPHQAAPYRDAIWEAIRTQAVYWVDWSERKRPSFPRPRNDALNDRLLLTLKNRQLVPEPAEDQLFIDIVDINDARHQHFVLPSL